MTVTEKERGGIRGAHEARQRPKRPVLIAALGALLVACGGPSVVDDSDQAIDLREAFLAGSFLPAPAAGDIRTAPVGLETRAAGEVLAFSTPGSLVVPLAVATGGSVQFDYRFRGAASPPASVAVFGLTADGERGDATRLAHSVDVWAPADIPVTSADGLAFLVVDASIAGDGSQSIEIRRPRQRPVGARGIDPSVEAPAPPSALPNVVIVILDAARASNFGVHGYARDTTPNIDRVAAEALVFRHAFSECPNTSCSIPNLISGIPFVDTGPPGAWHRLSDEITSLADYLGAIGYYTIGLSANPNNAIARNTSQGFHEFIEMWAWDGRERRHPDRRNPHRLSRTAIDAIRQVDAAQPVFALLHYVPPHEPYEPRPEFDLFGDPAYDGPVYPGMRFADVRDGKQTLDAADVEEMVALYDGNLLMADDAVQEVFDALRADRRWENTIVLVTSDHGEAFFEHGVQGHNSTLFDEMLHIPFILRLPSDRVPEEVDTDRLVILTDVVPTILGQVGVVPAREVGGVDLLRPDPATDPRVIFQRRSGERHFATRTLRWKALFSQSGQSMLFDLVRDPREQENLVETHPLLHHGFAAMLNGHRRDAERLRFVSDGVELPEEDLRELRSLGYLR